jgi:hypothetical protein|tara:strand:- start:1068 stop:1547 length:480 start_codon:yes stop_codon:yes gene_type:complete
MSELDNKVNEILGIETKEIDNTSLPMTEANGLVPRADDPTKDDIDNDYEYSRNNYNALIEKGQAAIDGILEIAREGQHPRAYEVVGQLIGSVGTTVDKLQDLQKKLKQLKDVPNKTGNANIKNALFVGSTAELQKMLKGDKNENIKSTTATPEKDNSSD